MSNHDDSEGDPVEVEASRRRSSLYVMAGSLGPKSLPGFSGRPPHGRSQSPQASPRERRIAYGYCASMVLIAVWAAWAYLAGNHTMAGYVLLGYFCALIALSLLSLVVGGLVAVLRRRRHRE